MIRRALCHMLLALALVLGNLTAVVAEARMAASGDYCGTGAPQVLLDAAGIPLLDANGTAIAAPECPACTISLAALAPARPSLMVRRVPLSQVQPISPPSLTWSQIHWDSQARAPPRRA